MKWIAPSEKDVGTDTLEKRLWPAADQFRVNLSLCRAAPLTEIEAQGWSLNAGRYLGVAAGEAVSGEDFREQLETLNEKLETLNARARELEQTIAANLAEIPGV